MVRVLPAEIGAAKMMYKTLANSDIYYRVGLTAYPLCQRNISCPYPSFRRVRCPAIDFHFSMSAFAGVHI